jgi:hypothetical protein
MISKPRLMWGLALPLRLVLQHLTLNILSMIQWRRGTPLQVLRGTLQQGFLAFPQVLADHLPSPAKQFALTSQAEQGA